MGILSLLERRASPNNPMTFAQLSAYIDALDSGRKTIAGAAISETSALNLSSVWAATRVRARTIASVPIHVYRRTERGREAVPDHPIHKLLHDRPNKHMTPYTFKDTIEAHVTTWGNGYAEKERNGRGEVVALWPITPNRVTPRWVEVRGSIEKAFDVQVAGVTKTLGADQIMHIPGPGFDGLVGYSRVGLARESLGLTKAAEEFGARLFGQGLKPSGVISAPPGVVNDKTRPNIVKSLEQYNAGLSNAQRLMLLEDGLTFTAMSIPPDDAQFLETRKFQTVEVARWFEVPPHMLADLDRATFSNIEHQSIEFVTQTARPIVINWENVLNWELFSGADRGRYYAEFNMDALLRGDSTARGDFYTARFRIGTLSQNDIREMENENPIDGGDRYFVPGELVPTDRIDDFHDAKMKPAPAGAPAPADPPASDPVRFRPVLLDAAERVLRREVEEIRAALKKGTLEFWAAGFYEDHAGFAAKRFLPVCQALGDDAARRASRMGADWASGSLAEIRRVVKAGEDVEAVVKRWEAVRAEEFVQSIIGHKEVAA